MWGYMAAFSAVALLGVVVYAREEFIELYLERKKKKEDKKKGKRPHPNSDQPDFVPATDLPSDEEVELSKQRVAAESEEYKINSAIETLREKATPVTHEQNPAMEAVNVVAQFRAEQDELPAGFDPNTDVLLTKELKKDFETIFRGTDVESFFGIGVSINKKGQLVVPMEAAGLLAKKYDPIISQGGTIVIRNLFDVDKAIALSILTKTPMFYRDHNKEIHQLSSEEVETLVANKETTDLLQRISEAQEENKALVKQLELVSNDLEAVMKERNEERKSREQLEERVSQKDAETDRLESEVEKLKLQMSTLKEVLSVSGAQFASTHESEKPKQAKAVPEDDVKTAPSKSREDHAPVAAEKKKKPLKAAAPETKQMQPEPSAEHEEKAEEATVATFLDLAGYIQEGLGSDDRDNFANIGLLSVMRRRNRFPRGRFDAERLLPYLKAKAEENGQALPELKVSDGYIATDKGRYFRVGFVDIELQTTLSPSYHRPYELQYYEQRAQPKNPDTDDKTKERYNALLDLAKRGEVPRLDTSGIKLIARQNEWQ